MMSVDYIVASLPALAFDAPAPLTWDAFVARAGRHLNGTARTPSGDTWEDLEAQLRNAMVEARGGAEKFRRPVSGCSVFWRGRIAAAFQEKDVAKREALLDRVWWDAAGELTPPANPLGKGALFTYAVRLKIALKRGAISAEAGNAAFDRLTADTRVTFDD